MSDHHGAACQARPVRVRLAGHGTGPRDPGCAAAAARRAIVGMANRTMHLLLDADTVHDAEAATEALPADIAQWTSVSLSVAAE
ncbi:hypothetical protein [Lichenicola sp.]|uniref:hypothetical protein n=1 Tax=Lichenicola sp. TaxID=2804529 RepID=UPI003AFF7944